MLPSHPLCQQGHLWVSSRAKVKEQNAAVSRKYQQYGMSWDKLPSEKQLCGEQPLAHPRALMRLWTRQNSATGLGRKVTFGSLSF